MPGLLVLGSGAPEASAVDESVTGAGDVTSPLGIMPARFAWQVLVRVNFYFSRALLQLKDIFAMKSVLCLSPVEHISKYGFRIQ